MDHLTSRFRRNSKKESPMSLQDPPTPDRKPVLPSLVIATSPSIVTTPPGSSHGSNVLLPKSPLRGFNNFGSAHKRGRSPTSAPFIVPNIMSNISPVNGTATAGVGANQEMTLFNNNSSSNSSSSNNNSNNSNNNNNGNGNTTSQPQMPAFLQLSEASVESRFQELIWLERLRYQQGVQNPSPTFRFARVLSPEAKILDRYANIQPWANNRVRLVVPEGKLDYINASPIVSPSPLRPNTRPDFKYIAMQGPKINTVEHTWRMLAQLESPIVIVMLTDTHDGHMEKCFPYFPRDFNDDSIEIGETDEFEDGFRGRVDYISLEERQDGAIQMRKLNLHVDGRGDTTVWHLLYRKWPDFGVPKADDYEGFFELMKLSRELNSSTVNPRIIHCSAGVGRTGTFIALETLMREIDEGAMDCLGPMMNDHNEDPVFQTVNRLREQRRTMVQADSQYSFIYQVLRHQWLERHGILDDIRDSERASKRLEVYHDPFVEHNG
ncbi:protein-tyrosine phosphatase-like protein [Xylaria nigripes]|nr:protein-tyrosine phosphatase-like protein [Xylaria nigripes]